jgi:hypothetical protein
VVAEYDDGSKKRYRSPKVKAKEEKKGLKGEYWVQFVRFALIGDTQLRGIDKLWRTLAAMNEMEVRIIEYQ